MRYGTSLMTGSKKSANTQAGSTPAAILTTVVKMATSLSCRPTWGRLWCSFQRSLELAPTRVLVRRELSPMSTVVQCPSCTKKYQVPDDKLGKEAKCQGCGHTFTLSI